MKISYKVHSLWQKTTRPIVVLIEVIDVWLWDKAHYQNGKGKGLGVPPLSIREAYRSVVGGEYGADLW